MKKLWLFIGLSAVLQILCGREEEWKFDFEKPSLPSSVTKDLFQNKAPVFKPYGTVQIVEASFEKQKKALRVQSKGRPVDIVTRHSIPVKTGDVFSVTVVFRSPDGKSSARVGMYNDYQAAEFKPVGKGFDMRQAVFEVRKKNVKKVQFFLAAKKGECVDYSYISIRRLGEKEATLYSPGKTRALWYKRTGGVNYALGKKVKFLPEPNYPLTMKGGTDQTDLTDGKLGKPNGMLWFDSKAVAFYRALNGVTMILDLGQVRNVGKTVIRINGGRPDEAGAARFPKVLEAYVSKDGKNFYRTHALRKTAVTESNMADWKDLYYLPDSPRNSVPCYVYPFEMNLSAEARFVALRAPVYVSLMMICDEWAVMKADEKTLADPSFNAAYRKDPVILHHESVILRPRLEKMYLDQNLALPQFLALDSRVKGKVKSFYYTMDFPKEVEFFQENSWPAFCRNLTKTERKGKRVIYTFTPNFPYERFVPVTQAYGMPFFFGLKGRTIPSGENYAVFTTYVNGKKMHVHTSPLEVLNIPEVPPFKRLNISLAWTENRHFATYPDYLRNMRHLGFNTLPVFPLSRDSASVKKRVEEAKKAGFLIRQQMSPAGLMYAFHKKETEIPCTSAVGRRSVCPSYRGKFYQKMLADIRAGVRDFPADFVTFDEEMWPVPALKDAMKCTRCNALRLQKKMSWAEFLTWVQADFLSPYKEMVRQGAAAGKKKMPVSGFYGTVPAGVKKYANIKKLPCGDVEFLGISLLWKNGQTDELQDSYYGRSSLEASKRARALYEYIRKPSVICSWITGGTGAHRETAYPKRTGQHLLETLMNGAGGIQYFMYPSFESPLDYYYHAEAMRLLAPREDILMDGTLDTTFCGSNKDLRYTRRDLGKTSLILLGNYEAVKGAESVLELPGARSVTELRSGKKLSLHNGKVTVTVPPDEYILLEVIF